MNQLTWTAEAMQLIKDLAAWKTNYEEGFEPTDDPYIDNTMMDIDVIIKRARDLSQEL